MWGCERHWPVGHHQAVLRRGVVRHGGRKPPRQAPAAGLARRGYRYVGDGFPPLAAYPPLATCPCH
eukprot:1225205-Pyramimonas_sp.AAC.1